MSTLTELIAEIESGPEGPEVGAFFDLDGTLIAGYSAQVFYQEFIRTMHMSALDVGRSVVAAADMAVRGSDMTRLVEIATGSWRGHAADELAELGERLFRQRIAGMVYPEARELVRAHRRMGHTVVLASSATRFQVAPLAEDLEIDHLLTTEIEVVDDLITGALAGKVLWGDEKARAARELASEQGVTLDRSYAYSNGEEDLPFLETVGRPHALNPESGLERAANERGWPVYRLTGRGRPDIVTILRTGVALSGLGTAAALGVGVGLLNRSRRSAANFATAVGSDAALALAGIDLRVKGEEHLWSHRPAVFVFNHQSGIDMPVIGSLLRRDITGVAKKEAARDPRFAPAGYLVDIAYVDRGNTTQAREALAPVVERVRSGMSLAIAPEGTRSPTPRLGRFKKGAFHIAMQAGVPVVPIVIRNAGDVMWRGSFFIRSGSVDVKVLEPIATDGWESSSIGRHTDEVRGRFVEALEGWTPGRDGTSARRGDGARR